MNETVIGVGGDLPYDVVVSTDPFAALPQMVKGASRVAVLFAPPVAPHVARVVRTLADAGVGVTVIEIPDAEAGKTIETAQRAWARLGEAGFTRNDAVVGVGGGAATDLAGFVAACWLRGVRWVPVATSVAGMVDAAVGGKTGVNIAAGKNLVGAFHPPAGVLCVIGALTTLPGPQLRAGLAEVVKGGFIADPRILELIEADPAAAVDPTGSVLRELVERKVRVKAHVVSEDLRESGLREILNYGHTLGHAIEKSERYRWRHGDAVSVGLMYAAILGRRTGRVDVVDRMRAILTSLDLPVTYRPDAWEPLLAAMRVDKKARGAALRFVLLNAVAAPETVQIDDEGLLREAYEELTGP
ncbi:3-dehydroquinate synthase [Allocatelliglobosispora scoriae]|uniref:3-dehydroquinate synthase n=2 Tax=Allocatelliglobosispora scoriae TaxID=643052 RepID=A0A841C1W2_9ACTN|nr:3-dehydroquinate synthase [Allocatelliglobosispora scoriae]MBB5873133.1 3-dehydroquinate synthase [Allocatelliglobosispora scoriae]